MFNKSHKYTNLKMKPNQYLSRVRQQEVSIPYITITGKWLEESGFGVGTDIRINAEYGTLTITPHDASLEGIVSETQMPSVYQQDYQGYRVNVRLQRSTGYEPVKLSCSKDVFGFLSSLQHESRELILSIMLDLHNRVVGVYEVGKGAVDKVSISFFEVMKAAILTNSRNLIIAHNHPTGNPEPSAEDRQATDKWVQASKLMDVTLIDHMIIGYGRYCSLRDMGYIK